MYKVVMKMFNVMCWFYRVLVLKLLLHIPEHLKNI